MKYWAYLNDEVSQKSYTEAELQQLPGFPDIIVCSETSAVSQEPEWKTIKELLPHLIRPKAPDFSKFRPKPPVPGKKEDAASLPVPEVLPAGVNATPENKEPQKQDNAAAGIDANLLAQIKSLTEKIASLEGKIEEENKELADKNLDETSDVVGDETFVSEPQNEQEDDVLEVPFDNDFEVPFDVNKSSEEIANEAEALLAKRDNARIEEYDIDDPNVDLMDYNSDMQEILEDTIRDSNFYPQQPEEKEKEKNTKKGKRTIIAEDLISKTTLNFSDKADNKDKKETADNTSENKEQPKEQEVKTDASAEEETSKEEKESEDIIEENNQEVKSLDELLVAENNNSNEAAGEAETETDSAEEKPESEQQEPVQENEVEQESKNVPENEIEKENTEENKEEKAEEPVQEEPVQETPVQEEQETVQEEKQEEKAEEEQPRPQLNSIDIAPEGNGGDSEQVQEEQSEPQLNSVDIAPEGNGGDSEQAQEEQPEPQLNSVDIAPEGNGGDAEQVQEQETKPQLVSLEGALEEHNEEIPEEKKEEEIVEEETHQEEPILPIEEELKEEEKENQEEPAQDEYLKTLALEGTSDETPEQLTIKEEPENKEETPQEEEKQEENNDLDISNKIFDSIVKKVEVPADDNNNNIAEQTANLSMTQGVTISKDDTTAAVLNEIAEEKAQQETKNLTTSDKLFAELENTYRNDGAATKEKEVVLDNAVSLETQETVSELNSNEDFAKEDEFLKTFTTSVEEVFLDQPTAIISDYVPPSDDSGHARPEALENSIKREKPSDIKTVPLVPEAMGQEIYSSPYVESATAKLGKKSAISNLAKWIVVILFVTIMAAGGLSALAVMGIISEKFSPIHTVIYSLQKSPKADEKPNETDLAPEMIDQNQTEEPSYGTQENRQGDVISQVKGYTFPDRTTLEERINSVNKNLSSEIEWNLFLTEEQNIYSIAVKIPQNKNGQGFSYRFNYNLTQNMLTPTTSEAKNIMENYSK